MFHICLVGCISHVAKRNMLRLTFDMNNFILE